jgi:metallo-beta-lactamase family protein
MKLTFLGGTRQVTGCNYLLEEDNLKIIIDCGLFQGSPKQEKNNFRPFDYDPKTINYALITHAHTDHIGRLPKLYKEGFRGTIYCSKPTKDLSRLNLLDSVKINEYESRKSDKPLLFTKKDALEALELFKGVDYHQKIKLNHFCSIEFISAGHILGSSIIIIHIKDKKIAFSGDLGNTPSPLIGSTEYVKEADYLVIESVNADTIYPEEKERKIKLERTIEETIYNNGVLMIPAFAIERTQELLYELNYLVENKRIPKVPIFMDSPLAISVTEVYNDYTYLFSKEALQTLTIDDELFNFPGLRLTKSKEESKVINDISPPKIIIAGSGMSTGGRILYHELRYLPQKNNCLLFIGYQVEGTLGRKILSGADHVEILGYTIPVNAKLKTIRAFSAHADQIQLIKFIKKIQTPLKKVFVTQGEEKAANILVDKIQKGLKIDSVAPKFKESFIL